jgi:hypothetical protein
MRTCGWIRTRNSSKTAAADIRLVRPATGIGYVCDRRAAIQQPLFNIVPDNGISLADGWIYIGQTGR